MMRESEVSRMINKIKKILNKKGFFSIEFTIIMLIVATVIAFMVDVTIIGVQRANMSRELQSLVNLVEKQSGIQGTMPAGFPGQTDTYYTPSRFVSLLEEIKENNSLTSLSVTINGREITDRTEFVFNHKETFEMKMEYGTSWGFLSKLIPSVSSDKIYSQQAIGFTEFKGDYDIWGGE